MEKVLRKSLIKKYFTDEIYIELLRILYIPNADNNSKAAMMRDVLSRFGIKYTSLGNGTNRFAVAIDGYAVKIALDGDGINTMVPIVSDNYRK